MGIPITGKHLLLVYGALWGASAGVVFALIVFRRRKIFRFAELSELVPLAHMGEISFGLIHDMASPTSLLMHYSSEISALQKTDRIAAQELISYSKGIEQATHRLVNLQRMFRAMAKNNSSLETAAVDLRQVILDCVALYKPLLDRNEIEIRACLDEGTGGDRPRVIQTSPGMIERILLNLIQNATHALFDCETRWIEIALQAHEGHFELQVRDSGSGIPDQRLQKLWEPFGFSSDKAKAQFAAPQGSGFGLYQVKKLVQSLQGEITVRTSRLGTTFSINLPKNVRPRYFAAHGDR